MQAASSTADGFGRYFYDVRPRGRVFLGVPPAQTVATQLTVFLKLAGSADVELRRPPER